MTKPSWLFDFVIHSAFRLLLIVNASHMPKVSPGCAYPLLNFPFIDSFIFTPNYLSFLANVSTLQETQSFIQASCHKGWVEAMTEKLKALERNHT